MDKKLGKVGLNLTYHPLLSMFINDISKHYLECVSVIIILLTIN